MVWIIIGAVVWYLVGMAGFVFWWTTDFDFTTSEFMACLCIGLAGPLTWWAGACIHIHNHNIIIRKRPPHD